MDKNIVSYVEAAEELIQDAPEYSKRKLWKEFARETIEILYNHGTQGSSYHTLANNLNYIYSNNN
ncbi:hypothetical protein J4226_05955 [Candidatus Pacearchaeota archaeon]|nr:hypothetical protein [Candidatus Pacearchaeota archaeon]